MKKTAKTIDIEKEMAPRKKGSLWGVLLIVLGVVLLLNTFGFFKEIFFSVFGMFWPIGLILAGVFFILRIRYAGHLFLILTIVLGFMYLLSGHTSPDMTEQKTFTQKIKGTDDIRYVDMTLEYGAGQLSITKGDIIYLNKIETRDGREPTLDIDKEGDTMHIDVTRQISPGFWHHGRDTWDIELSPDVVYNLDIDFGAADMDVDLRGLSVRRLDVDTGASDSHIIFGSYPTQVEIDTGASSVECSFPSDMHVLIKYDGGASSIDLDGFYKEDDIWYSEGFDDSADAIAIKINAGASSISGSFYEVTSLYDDIVDDSPLMQKTAEEEVFVQLDIVNGTDNISQEI